MHICVKADVDVGADGSSIGDAKSSDVETCRSVKAMGDAKVSDVETCRGGTSSKQPSCGHEDI